VIDIDDEKALTLPDASSDQHLHHPGLTERVHFLGNVDEDLKVDLPGRPLSETDFPAIEAEMARIIQQAEPFGRPESAGP
jgi:threonyl-tRNA synthetase